MLKLHTIKINLWSSHGVFKCYNYGELKYLKKDFATGFVVKLYLLIEIYLLYIQFIVDSSLACKCWKIHIMCTVEKLNGSTSLENDNMRYVSFRIREQENAYLGVVKFKTEDQKFLRRLLIFTPISLDAQDVWSLNQFPRRE